MSNIMKQSTPEAFVPPPFVKQHAVLALGFGFFLLGSLSRTAALVVAFSLSIIIPYCFRTTDHPEERRRLYREYVQRPDALIQKVTAVPTFVNLEERLWVNSRGMALHTCILTPKHKDTKAVLFFCHGFGDNISFLKRYNFFKYVNEGIAVVAIEYEGHGRSDGPLCLIPDFNQTVTDAVEFFQEVAEERFAGKKCFLMGESMGGAIAFLAYKMKPSLFSGGVVFIAPMCKISDSLKPAQWIVDLLLTVTGPIGSNGYLGYLPVAPMKQDWDNLTHRDVIMKDLSKSVPFLYDRNPRLTTARELLNATTMVSSQMESFDAPFLIQHGKADRVTDPKLSQELYDEAKSTDKTIKLYEGMYHSITADVPSETEIVLNDSIQWLLKRV